MRRWFCGCAFLACAVIGFGQQENTVGKDQRSRPAPPTKGTGDGYYFERVSSVSNVYAVTFADTGERVLVSDSFVGLITSAGLDNETKRLALKGYPDMVKTNYASVMAATYPDHTQAPSEPFVPFETTASNGVRVSAEQDAMAAPYVRLTVRGEDGRVETFSVNRKTVDDLLGQENMNADFLVNCITTFPFHLPEQARMGFAYMTRDQLWDQVMKLPELQRQEMVRMPRFYRERANDVMAELATSSPIAVVTAMLATVVYPSNVVTRTSRRAVQGPVRVETQPVAPAVESAPKPADRRWVWIALAASGWAAAFAAWAVARKRKGGG